MTNEEKARELAFTENGTFLPRSAAIIKCCNEMAEWKDEQYKKVFEVPDYCKSFEEITNYIGHDVFAKGYNKAKAYDREQLKEYLEKKEELFNTNCLSVEPYIDFMDEIINELFN